MRTSRTVPATLAALLTAAALTGCTPDGPTEQAPPIGDALASYTDLYDDAIVALQKAPDGRELTWAESMADYPSIAEQNDGLCFLYVRSANGTGTIDDAEGLLTSLAASLDTVLAEHGMEPMSDPQHSEHGGDVWVETVAPTGWTVELKGGGQSSPEQQDARVELSIDGPVTSDTCNDTTLAQALTDAG
ncbi:hypothetical protein C8K30_101373 [Promicromonospora sp. AC04]|uniref:hypothetical protein n=1 Tax=Promicromonospora sp. AC04 TaxID=2135723 RepID=UPI000D372FEF|nr:hypothetical protein [Promicromonospora sp. AC04]PUB31856.1 hypothetical protein C8K30_101373 [Promicromonospora sp. AC04]